METKDTKARIYEALVNSPEPLTMMQIAERAGCSRTTVVKMLPRLIRVRKVKRAQQDLEYQGRGSAPGRYVATAPRPHVPRTRGRLAGRDDDLASRIEARVGEGHAAKTIVANLQGQEFRNTLHELEELSHRRRELEVQIVAIEQRQRDIVHRLALEEFRSGRDKPATPELEPEESHKLEVLAEVEAPLPTGANGRHVPSIFGHSPF